MGAAATTGPALYPGSATFPGSTTYPGQGDVPQIEVLYSTDDYTDPTPVWQYAHHGVSGTNSPGMRLRSYSADRGRETELDEIDAGTATIELDNRLRDFDPTFNPEIE